MPRKPENLPKHELIGLKAKVKEHTDKQKEGIKGEVLDETRDMIRIDDKWIEKKNTTFTFYLNDQKIDLKGDIIKKRPEDRINSRIPPNWNPN